MGFVILRDYKLYNFCTTRLLSSTLTPINEVCLGCVVYGVHQTPPSNYRKIIWSLPWLCGVRGAPNTAILRLHKIIWSLPWLCGARGAPKNRITILQSYAPCTMHYALNKKMQFFCSNVKDNIPLFPFAPNFAPWKNKNLSRKLFKSERSKVYKSLFL